MKTSKTLSLEIATVERVEKMKTAEETFSGIVDKLIADEYARRLKPVKKGK